MNEKWRRSFLYPIIITCIATSIIAVGITWIIVRNAEKAELKHYYYEIDGLTCIVLLKSGISCNWENWNRDENSK